MDYFEEFGFKAPKQQRAIKTVEEIIKAMEELSRSGDLEEVGTRELSEHSGHSIGSIFHHFKKIEDIYLYIFLLKRRKGIEKLADIINQHPSDQPLRVLMGHLIKSIIDDLSRPPRKILSHVIHQYLKRAKVKALLDIESDSLIPLIIKVSQQDKTNTFHNFNENELTLRIRTIHSITWSPFLEEDPIAGTNEHLEMAINLAAQLFAAPVLRN